MAEDIAAEAGVSVSQLMQVAIRMSNHDISLNAPIGNSSEGNSAQIQDIIEDEQPDPAEICETNEKMKLGKQVLREVLSKFTEREQGIFVARHLIDSPMTLEDLGAKYGVSRERIRQIENKVLDRARREILRSAKSRGIAADKRTAELLDDILSPRYKARA